MNVHVTQRSVQAAKPPASGYRILFDRKFSGFGIRITAAGAKSFVLNYRAHGRKRRFTIGSFPKWTADAARDEALRLCEAIRKGADPLYDKEVARGEPTVADLANDYLDQHATPHKKPSSVKQDRRMIEKRVVPALGQLKVSAVGRRDIEKLHNSLRKTPYEANRVQSLLSKMFSLAIKWKMRQDNPCKGIPRFEEPKHEFWLTVEQFQRLELALNEYPVQGAADAIRLLALTGSRQGEALNATWDQFDLERGIWTKPSHATKQKRTESVPLNERALLLLRRMAESKKSAYLFPRSDDATKPRTTVRDVWEMACRKAGLSREYCVMGNRKKPLKRWKPTIRINDLRHSFASHLVSKGASLYQVGKLIGHTQPNTTQRYAHCADAALRAVANDFTVFGNNNNVVEMPKKTA